ncbi:hypothetical protein ANN_07559 [Periplaneta americana]|uniref:Uncharacterized protein n=1 Tax=Periplaneta americana TaxID=6978 RepID=A0ABQ8SZ09_PERAM|nr:hypothetical protein ANN_07559 [Periplaneta americana]
MSPGSSTESYPAFARIGLRENPGKKLNQVTCPDQDSNPGHLVSQPDALTVTPQECPNQLRSATQQLSTRAGKCIEVDVDFLNMFCKQKYTIKQNIRLYYVPLKIILQSFSKTVQNTYGPEVGPYTVLMPFSYGGNSANERIPNLTGEQSDGITVFRIPPMTVSHRCHQLAEVVAVSINVSTKISQNFASVAQKTTCTVAMTASILPAVLFLISLQRDVIDATGPNVYFKPHYPYLTCTTSALNGSDVDEIIGDHQCGFRRNIDY